MYLRVETTDCELLRQIIMFSFICWSKKKNAEQRRTTASARRVHKCSSRLFLLPRLLLWRQHRKKQCVSLCMTSEQLHHSVCVDGVSASYPPTPAACHELPGVGRAAVRVSVSDPTVATCRRFRRTLALYVPAPTSLAEPSGLWVDLKRSLLNLISRLVNACA